MEEAGAPCFWQLFLRGQTEGKEEERKIHRRIDRGTTMSPCVHCLDGHLGPCFPNLSIKFLGSMCWLLFLGVGGRLLITSNIRHTETGFGQRPGGGKRHPHVRDSCDHASQGGPMQDKNIPFCSDCSAKSIPKMDVTCYVVLCLCLPGGIRSCVHPKFWWRSPESGAGA